MCHIGGRCSCWLVSGEETVRLGPLKHLYCYSLLFPVPASQQIWLENLNQITEMPETDRLTDKALSSSTNSLRDTLPWLWMLHG